MSQQPYYPQYPQQPQQQAPTPQQFVQPQFPQQAQPYAPQGYPQQPPAQQPQQPLATGTLDDYYNQPGAGTGPSLSWKDKPIGTSYAGIVARDVTNADIQQQTDPQTKQPKFFKDGRPQFVMKVPLKVQPSQEFPEGEATYFVRGQARDELVRAMGEAGVDGAPKGGAGLVVTLVQRRPSRMGNPANVVQIRYQPPQGSGAPSPAPEPASQAAPAPEQQQYVGQEQAPPQQYQQQVPVPQQQPVQQAPAQQPVQQQVQQQAPAQPQPPSDLSAEQQQLFARLTGGNQQ